MEPRGTALVTDAYHAAMRGRPRREEPRWSPHRSRRFGLSQVRCARKTGGGGKQAEAYRLVMTLSRLALGLLGTLTVWTFWLKGSRPRQKG